jgi:hypothetical protein
VATPITIIQRRAALDRAIEAMDIIRAAAEALSWSLGVEAAQRLTEAAEAASGAIHGLRRDPDTDLHGALTLAAGLSETVEEVGGDLPADLGELLMSAATHVLDPLLDVAVLGLGRPLPRLAPGRPARSPTGEALPAARAIHSAAGQPGPGSPAC